MKYDITSDGVTVWVNGEDGLLGRFGRMGIDVHHPPTEQFQTGECLFCTHARTNHGDWNVFVAKMKEHFGINVPEEHRPRHARSTSVDKSAARQLQVVKPPPRKQCEKCPWKMSTNPLDIPGQYCEKKHAALDRTIAPPSTLTSGPLHVMACHETRPGKELVCVGWLINQLGTGNNLGLRLAVMEGRIDANVRTVGPQHERFEDTLPKLRRRVFLGFRAKTLDDKGEVGEYTDPMPTRKKAARYLRQHRTFMSRGCKRLVTVKVFVWRKL